MHRVRFMSRLTKSSALVFGILLSLSIVRLALFNADSPAYCLDNFADPKGAQAGRVTCDTILAATKEQRIQIVDMAQKFARGAALGDLWRAEKCVVIAAANGQSVWLGESSNYKFSGNDPEKDWPGSQDRTIRPPILAWLLTDPNANKLLTRKGVSIGGAVIPGPLDLSDASNLGLLRLNYCKLGDVNLSNATARLIDLSGSKIILLDGTQMRVNGDLYLNSIVAVSTLDLTDAEVDGNFHAANANLKSKGDSLILASATIGGSVYLSGTSAQGMFRATRATVNQDLTIIGSKFGDEQCNGLQAAYAVVKGNLWWEPAVVGKHTELDLIGASAGTFHNYNVKAWPHQNCLFLDGFEFSRLAPDSHATETTLKSWLDLQPDRAHDVQFSTKPGDFCDTYEAKNHADIEAEYPNPQPFKELAGFLRDSGKDDEATDLLIDEAQEDLDADIAANPRNPRTWAEWIWGKVACFGYSPLHTFRFILFFVGFGWVVFWIGSYMGLIVPTDKDAFDEYVKGYDSAHTRRPPVYYQLFNSFFYSLETFLPLVDLFQAKNWLPNPQREPQAASRLLRGYLWIHIIAGWFFTTALLAGLSGLFQK